jgi:hypothetical protein
MSEQLTPLEKARLAKKQKAQERLQEQTMSDLPEIQPMPVPTPY